MRFMAEINPDLINLHTTQTSDEGGTKGEEKRD